MICFGLNATSYILLCSKIYSDFSRNVFGEIAPVAAVTGGVLAQEVVKAVSRKDVPLINLFVYNPVDGTGYVENFAG